jgi:threonine synthase
VSEREIVDAQRLLARVEGIWTAPEAAATLAALLHMKADGQVEPTTRVVLVLTGAGIKYPPPALPRPAHLEGTAEAMLARFKEAMGQP